MALTKAKILVEGQSIPIPVLFNPTEYSLEMGNEFAWRKIPGLTSPIAQFITGEAPVLSMELFFDSYERGTDVRADTARITDLLKIQSSTKAPPIVRFVWGSLDFRGVLEKVSQKFTMFLDTGVPVRATLNVSFKYYRTIQEQAQASPSLFADLASSTIVRAGEHLWSIASSVYNDVNQWRSIADANGIDNPLDLISGSTLQLPKL